MAEMPVLMANEGHAMASLSLIRTLDAKITKNCLPRKGTVRHRSLFNTDHNNFKNHETIIGGGGYYTRIKCGYNTWIMCGYNTKICAGMTS